MGILRIALAVLLISAGVGIVLSIRSGGLGQASSSPTAAVTDIHAVRAVTTDFPAGYVPWEGHGGVRDRSAGERWRGKPMDPSKPPSPYNQILETAHAGITIWPTPADAVRQADRERSFSQAIWRSGTFSGAQIGDICFRPPEVSSTSASLIFVRKNVSVSVGLFGRPPVHRNWQQLAEAAAQALVDRIDAAAALEASSSASVAVGGSQLAGRMPNGIAVVHVKEFAGAVGGRADVDFDAGTATIAANGHTLLLHVGRKEAWLDGNPITLPFPALRHGLDQVWCPVDTLNSLGFGAQVQSVRRKSR